MSCAVKNISIALAAYNGSNYIAEQLQSLLAQELLPSEIVITDDSANDLTYEAVKPFLSSNIVRYIKNPYPLGVVKNFEKAISLCTGEYIFLCDQDDVWLPEKTALLSNMLADDPRLDAVFCNSDQVDHDLHKLDKTLWKMRKFSPAMQKSLAAGEALKVYCKRIPLSSHNIAFKRRALEYLLPFPELEPFYPDTWIALAIALNGKWQALDRSLTLYRVHQSNCSAPAGNALQAARHARRSSAALRNNLLAQELLKRAIGSDPAKEKILKNFALHHRKRSLYSKHLPIRLLQTAAELCSLRYFKYSNGLKTAAADLLIPPAQGHQMQQ